MEQITPFVPTVQVVEGTIIFPEYKKLLSEAQMIAERIGEMTVTDENIKDTKKTLATVNKSLKALNDRRIEIKKEIMMPYDIFADQIKEIESIVRLADDRVRQQVREMEEAERQKKQEALEEIWDKRIQHYDHAKVMAFGDWLEPSHLNKTLSISKAESSMVAWLEQTEKDIAVLAGMDHKDQLILKYRELGSIADAIEAVKADQSRIDEQRKMLDEEVQEEVYFIRIFNTKDLKLAEMLLKENKIEFETIKK